MKRLLLALTFLVAAIPLFSQSIPPAPSSGHWLIVDTTYEVGTSSIGTTEADLYFRNNTTEKITGLQFRVFYDKVAFSGAEPTVSLLYNSSNQYMQYVADSTNGHITVTMVYTGSSTTFNYNDSAAVKVTFTHAPASTWNTLASIDSLKITGTQTFNNLASTNLGNDTTLTLYSYGGAFIQKTLSFKGRFLTTGGDGAETIWLSLDKKPKTGSTWTQVNAYSTDSTGRFSFTETLDTTYWDTRISVQGDTLNYGNILSTADAQKINQTVLGQHTPAGFDFYTMDLNGSSTISIADAYSVFSRIAGGLTAWSNSVPELLFFTDTEFSAIDGSSTDQSSTYPGVTNFTHYINGGVDSVTYYVSVKGDANSTGYNMARLTPIEIVNPNNAPNYIIDQTVEYKNVMEEIELRFPDLEVTPGNLVEVPVKVLSADKKVGALQLNIKYDDALLEFRNIENSAKVMRWLSFFDPSSGKVAWGGADFSNSNLLDNGEVAFTLQFVALEPKQDWTVSPLWVAEKYVGDVNSKDMNIRPTNGRVQVFKVSWNPGVLDGVDVLTYPNPTTDYTIIQFNVPQEGPVELCIFDLTGRKLIEVIKEDNMPAGQYRYDVDLSILAEGVYYSSLLSQDGVATSKVVIIK
jgi:hypothetical protein